MRYYGTIYKITNKINNKCYIGQTTEKDPLKRVNRHFYGINPNSLINTAINKYGKNKFIITLLLTCFDSESLNFYEQYYIKLYNSNKKGYNQTNGGENSYKLSRETKLKISKKAIEYYKYNDHPKKGKKYTKEYKELLEKQRQELSELKRKEVVTKQSKYRMKKIEATNIKSKESIVFESVTECCSKLNLILSCVTRVCNGKQGRTQHRGWKFRYLDDSNAQPLPDKSQEFKGLVKSNEKYIINIKRTYLGYLTLENAKKVRDLALTDLESAKKLSLELATKEKSSIWQKRKQILDPG
jgi:group I intron endonuclease